MNGAEIIARRLAEAGCRHAFGIPGGEVLALVDALEAAGIAFHLCKHENAGGFMAEGVHHHDGAPAVLVATIGPGAANLVNVAANALQDKVPMIILTGCVDEAEAASYTHQVLDHGAFLGPVTKASLKAVHGAVDVLVDKALNIALDGQPGPVHLDLPITVATAAQPEAAPVRRPSVSPMAPAAGAGLDQARRWLDEARRPLVIAGVDVLNQNAAKEVAGFAHRFNIPLITTYKGKGILDEHDPLALGGAGLSPRADALLLPLVQQADLVILAGYDPVEMRAGWRNPWGEASRVVDFSAVPGTHYMHVADLGFVGDIAAGLAALAANMPSHENWRGGEIGRLKADLARAFPTDESWGPAAVIDTVQQAVPAGTVATADTGAHRILLSQMWRCAAPRSLLQSSGLCTMGCALPLAIGNALAQSGRPVLAFTGDAGLEMVLGELATLRDLQLPVIIIVFVDEQLALIELKQRGMGLARAAVDFGGTDFVALAEAMGGSGVLAGDRESLRAAVDEAQSRRGFTLIACPIGARAYDGRL